MAHAGRVDRIHLFHTRATTYPPDRGERPSLGDVRDALLIVVGAVVGVVADRLVGPRLDALANRLWRWSRRRRTSGVVDGRIARLGGSDLVVKCADVRTGWSPSQVRIKVLGDRPAVADLIAESLVRESLPGATELQREIDDVRRRMDGDDDAQWNLDHLGPRLIDPSRDDDEPYVLIEADVHDWATHRVLRDHAEGWATGDPSRHLGQLRRVDRLTSTTLRVFLSVFTADGTMVLGRRGTKTGIDCPDTRCTPLEAWVLASDAAGGRVDLRAVVGRALDDQFGTDARDELRDASLVLHTIVLNLRTLNWSILGYVDFRRTRIDGTGIRADRSLAPADLHWIADPLEFVPLRRRNVRALLNAGFDGWMPEAAMCTRNSLALRAPSLLGRGVAS